MQARGSGRWPARPKQDLRLVQEHSGQPETLRHAARLVTGARAVAQVD